MKYLLAVCVGILAIMRGFALPSATWLPADVDFVAVTIPDQGKDTAAQRAWEVAFTKVDPDLKNQFCTVIPPALFTEQPQIATLLQALFGVSTDNKQTATRSLTLGVVMPKSPEQIHSGKGVLFIENPTLDIGAVDRALQALLDEVDLREQCDLSRQGDWRLITLTPPHHNSLFGYRAVPQGLMIAFAQDLPTLEAWLASPKLKTEQPLSQVFSCVKQSNDGAFILKDLAALAKRFASTKEQQELLAMQAPWLFNTHQLFYQVKCAQNAFTGLFSAVTDNAESAGQLKNNLEMYRLLLAQMVLPSAFKTQQTALGQFLLEDVQITTQGSALHLTFKLTPERGAAIYQAFKTLQERQAMQFNARFVPDEENDETSTKQMTSEEAQAILDGLDGK